MSIAAVVLAAGASRRLGRAKQTVEIGGETLLARAVRVANAAQLVPVIVVIADLSFAKLVQVGGGRAVINTEAGEGMASSIRAGIAEARTSRACGAVLMACDQVGVSADHLRALCAAPESAAGSGYADTVGIPAYFPRSYFEDLLRLRGDRGARDLLVGARTVATEALAIDIDTEADLLRARQSIENEDEHADA